jgi:putative spermidine/putrescine transport system permease protein
MPNLRTSIVSATFLTVAVVLGEFTIASILLRHTLPTFQAEYRSDSPRGAYALSVLFLLGTAAIFAVLSLATRSKASRAKDLDEVIPVGVADPEGLAT